MDKLVFMGHVLTPHGIGPAEDKVKAVLEARRPESASEVRSFLGLVQFNSRYIPDLATVSEPLRKLTQKNVTFVWGSEQDIAFQKLKQRLANADTLGYFQKNAKTKIVDDASPVGLGGILIQTQDGEDRIISYASASLTDTEKRYSQTEKEALAIVWACERFHLYLYGVNFEMVTDHKPLEYIYSTKGKRSVCSARIQRWVLRLQPYSFKVVYKPGKENIADSLSRLTKKSNENALKRDIAEEFVKFVAQTAAPDAVTIKEIERMSADDEELREVRQSIINEDWKTGTVSVQYLAVRDELSTIGKVVLRGTRIVPPVKLRNKLIVLAHEGHLGIVGTKQRLRTRMWWPGMDRETEKFVRSCHGCQLVSKQAAPEPLRPTKLPSGPWQDISVDLLGPLPSNDYILVAVDYYSRYYEIDIMKSVTSAKVIDSLEKMFTTHGSPVTLTSDNGPQFVSSEFAEFMKREGVFHRRVTPLYPAANGEVERQNRSLLKRLKIAQAENKDWKHEIRLYLRAYRCTPHSVTGVPPAELMFRRRIRTKLPEFRENFETEDGEVRDKDFESKTKSCVYTDERRAAKDSNIQPGDEVLVKQPKENKLTSTFENQPYHVVNKEGNSVIVESPEGVRYRRNSTHVKRYIRREKSNDLQDVQRDLRHSFEESDNNHSPTSDNIGEENKSQNTEFGISRPSRSRVMPRKFEDYVMGK